MQGVCRKGKLHRNRIPPPLVQVRSAELDESESDLPGVEVSPLSPLL